MVDAAGGAGLFPWDPKEYRPDGSPETTVALETPESRLASWAARCLGDSYCLLATFQQGLRSRCNAADKNFELTDCPGATVQW
jgi:hypothetical protein